MADDKRKNLGRGLSALLGEAGLAPAPKNADPVAPVESTGGKAIPVLPISALTPSRYQPRRQFDEQSLAELADSMRTKGVLQPILVRVHPTEVGLYEIIAGERRWRAAQRAQLHEIPVLIRELTDQEAAEIALVENLQRRDLSPLEEAEGYRRLIEEFKHTQEELSRAVGKSRPHLANMMRLLALPESVKALVDDGTLSAGHARALLTAKEPEALAREVVAKGLS
ncbi:MAG TPA: ParB/RepB/Spo0J family partition protein, partial [Rhodospirillaceae bacterium]|nr:ParB/RepB/Spo0J family partition protein [Rhodospirillaceae bacterium]